MFSIICKIKEIYRTIRYSMYISGHEFVEQDNNDLKCEVCGFVSETKLHISNPIETSYGIHPSEIVGTEIRRLNK